MRTPELEAAFLATTYRVETHDACFDLRIGLPDPAFDDFLTRQSAASWGIVTACNPGGVLTLQENAERNGALLARIKALGWQRYGASNLADSGQWPVEPGYCVLDADEAGLRRLAAEFGQAAIVCGQTGRMAGGWFGSARLQVNKYEHLEKGAVKANIHALFQVCLCRSPIDGRRGAVRLRGSEIGMEEMIDDRA